jgi:hypothetical protein
MRLCGNPVRASNARSGEAAFTIRPAGKQQRALDLVAAIAAQPVRFAGSDSK